MKISIIGAGNIGSTLAKKWAQADNQVSFGVRNPSDPKFDDLRPLGQVCPVAEAVASAEVLLLSLPGTAVAEFAAQFGAALDDKLVIDATNNTSALWVRSADMYPVGLNNLAVLGEKAPGAHLVRAFSTLGWENFAEPSLGGQPIDLFYCGEPGSQAAADQLISEIGLRPICLGGLDTVDLVDNLTRLWLRLVFTHKRSRRLAFKLVEE